MGQKRIDSNASATQMVNDINSNFGELYQGAGGGSVSGVPTKLVNVYDVMDRAGGGSGHALNVPCNIKAGDKFVITKSDRGSNWNNLDVYFLDTNKSTATRQLALQTNGSGVATTGGWGAEVTASQAFAYIQINGYSTSVVNVCHKEAVLDTGNRWMGKKWLVIGDSISTDHADEAEVGYAELVAKSLGMLKQNVACSGSTVRGWLLGNTDYVTKKYDEFSLDYDLITVMLGTNDMVYTATPIGSLNDSVYQAGIQSSMPSYIARLQLLYEGLRQRYPKSVIAFLTPIRRYNKDGSVFTVSGRTTADFAQAVRDVCEYYAIPCIDIYDCIDARTQTQRDNFYIITEGSHDGTHPNDVGHALFVAPIVEARLREIAPFYFNVWT